MPQLAAHWLLIFLLVGSLLGCHQSAPTQVSSGQSLTLSPSPTKLPPIVVSPSQAGGRVVAVGGTASSEGPKGGVAHPAGGKKLPLSGAALSPGNRLKLDKIPAPPGGQALPIPATSEQLPEKYRDHMPKVEAFVSEQTLAAVVEFYKSSLPGAQVMNFEKSGQKGVAITPPPNGENCMSIVIQQQSRGVTVIKTCLPARQPRH